MSSKEHSKSFALSIGSLLFKKRAGSSVQKRRGSSDSIGFQVRSRSLENLVDVAGLDIPPMISELGDKWSEVDLLKNQGTHIVCILPTTSLDFIVSCLYAIKVYPLIPEDADDVERLLTDCKGVLVDVSARAALLEAFTKHHIGGIVPLVLVVTNSGTDDKRKTWARKIIEKCEPTLVTGRLGDIHALSQDVVERAGGILEENEYIDAFTRSSSASPAPAQADKKSPPRSPLPKSPPRSPLPKSPLPGRRSPHIGRRSPIVRKDVGKKMFGRVNTAIPHAIMKGQFRHGTMKDFSPQLALESGRQLSAHCNCYVHMFELNIVTCGEFFIETTNNQLGMDNLHSIVQCAAAIITSTLACVEEEGQEISLLHCSHGVSFYCVVAETSSADATLHVEAPQPGTLRTCFIDNLHQMEEIHIRLRASIVKHNLAPGQ